LGDHAQHAEEREGQGDSGLQETDLAFHINYRV